MVVAVVILNQFVGPFFMKFALLSAGEVHGGHKKDNADQFSADPYVVFSRMLQENFNLLTFTCFNYIHSNYTRISLFSYSKHQRSNIGTIVSFIIVWFESSSNVVISNEISTENQFVDVWHAMV